MTHRPVIAYVGPKFKEHNSWSKCLEQIGNFERELDCHIHFYPDIQMLLIQLSDKEYQVDFVDIDLEYLRNINGNSMFDIIRTVSVFLKFTHRDSKILGVVGHDTDTDLIRQSLHMPEIWSLTQRLGGPWTFDVILQDVQRYFNGDRTVPKAIRNLIKPVGRKIKHPSATIVLTPRQSQILDLVSTRGASNKVIARTLKISESTVKLHMSAILKKYGCRNRTQLAVFSQPKKQDQIPA